MSLLEATGQHLVQRCDNCGAQHTIPLKQGWRKGKQGPYTSVVGDVLEVSVDAGSSQGVSFSAGDFSDPASPTAAEIVARISAAITGAVADIDHGAPRIVSNSTVVYTTVIQVSGTAQGKLGFPDGAWGACYLGTTVGTDTLNDVICLPICPQCGANECLVRQFDVTPPGYEHSRHVKQRQCVNAVAMFLKNEGFSHPDSKPSHDAETEDPAEIDANFPAQSITLPAPT